MTPPSRPKPVQAAPAFPTPRPPKQRAHPSLPGANPVPTPTPGVQPAAAATGLGADELRS